jgi:hypothetical protein
VKDHVSFRIDSRRWNVLNLKLNDVLVRQSLAECQFDVASDAIRREVLLEYTGFVPVDIMGSSEVSVKRLKVRHRRFGWPIRRVEGSRLAQMVVGITARCDAVNARGVGVLSINVAIVEERR